LKLCVFPNDPIIDYYKKGEIKERYFNPNNIFSEVHIISFTDSEIEESKVKTLVGDAELRIHCVGKINLKNRTKFLQKVIELVEDISPDVIRAYNSLLAGWFAAKCSKQLGIPFFLSLHTQYDHNRELVKKNNLKKFLALKYTEKFIEPFVIKSADKITIVFKIIESYVLKHRTDRPEVLYNKINCAKFSTAQAISDLSSPLIISVGRLIPEKNHQCLINAMKDIDAHLLIIGNGPMHQELSNMIKKENLENKITIKQMVPHDEIARFYKSATVFALAYDTDLEGLPIPVIEAMAAGLPIVIPPLKKGFSDGLEEVALFANNDPNSFANKIKEILNDDQLKMRLSERSLDMARKFDETVIEKREAEIYLDLAKKR
jgi:glycosyltransferase involved in cell wall biosynthesis